MKIQKANIDTARDALHCIPADCDRQTWVKMAMAIHSEWPGQMGFNLWDTWSQQGGDKYDEKSATATWKTLMPGVINLGKLYQIAKQNGFVFPKKKTPAKAKTTSSAPQKTSAKPSKKKTSSKAQKPPQAAPTSLNSTKPYPPRAELVEVLKCRKLAQDKQAQTWCESRKLDVIEIDRLRLAGVISKTKKNLPHWTPNTKVGKKYQINRLFIPLYDHFAKIKSISARFIGSAKTTGAKAKRPTGCNASGLCMMNQVAKELIAGKLKNNAAKTHRVKTDLIICEGEPDYLTRATLHPDIAVMGIYQGSFTARIAAAIPAGTRVYIETDSDTVGDKYASKIAGFIRGKCRLYRLKPNTVGDINDRHLAGELASYQQSCRPYIPPPPRQIGNKPILWADEDPDKIVRAIWQYLESRNKQIYQAGQVQPGIEPLFLSPAGAALCSLKWRENSEGMKTLDLCRLTASNVLGILTHSFAWQKETEKGISIRDPKKTVVELIHADSGSGIAQLDYIHSINRTPVFDRDGVIIDQPGYNAIEKIWYEPGDDIADMRPIPDHPSAEDIIEAKEYFTENLLFDFDFIGEAELATAIAAFLLPFVRCMIAGPTPIHLIEAPIQGSGKSLLAHLISIVATGEDTSPITLNYNEEETEKKLASVLLRGRPLVIIDNVDTTHKPLNSPALSIVTTALTFTARRLGVSEMMDLSTKTTWIMTGNNVKLSSDLIRRFVRCRLDPGSEQPWTRSTDEFKHPDLVGWATDHRVELARAALVLCQAWIAADRPKSPTTIGSYEAWASVIGGILHHAGIDGFLANTNAFYGLNDAETDDWRPFVLAWWRDKGDQPITATELNELCDECGYLTVIRGEKSSRSQTTRLGKAIKSQHERIIEGVKIIATKNSHSKNWEYSLESTKKAPKTNAEIQTEMTDF